MTMKHDLGVGAVASRFDALSTTFHMPRATTLSELTRAPEAEPQEDFLPVPVIPVICRVWLLRSIAQHQSSQMQSFCVLCRCLCHPTMVWFVRSSVFSPFTCTGLRSRFSGNSLTWDCKAIQANQRLHRFPGISENKLLEWKEWLKTREGLCPKIFEYIYQHLQVMSCHGDFSLSPALGNDT